MIMKKNYLFIILLFLFTFIFSNNMKVNQNKKMGIEKRTDFTKLKKPGFIKKQNINNNDLKIELQELENELEKNHKFIRASYKEKIIDLKEKQKSEIKSLKKTYNKRRKDIYKKYGVSPPKKTKKNKNNETLKIKKKHKNLPKIK